MDQICGIRRVLNRDCRKDEGAHCVPLLHFPPCAQRSVRSGDVMQEENLIHLPVRPNLYNLLFYVLL
jgi:hypothetical protein